VKKKAKKEKPPPEAKARRTLLRSRLAPLCRAPLGVSCTLVGRD
jgi:hypothetical protein